MQNGSPVHDVIASFIVVTCEMFQNAAVKQHRRPKLLQKARHIHGEVRLSSEGGEQETEVG